MRICVFCSSSDAVDGVYLQAASRMGELIGGGGHSLVFGGGRVGLMGAIARAVHGSGGRVIGVIPAFMNSDGVTYRECDELEVTKTMAERKARMEALAQAFVALPGGFGTLEELSQVITLKQFGIVTGPLVAVSTGGFYDALAALFERYYQDRFAKPAFRATCPFVGAPEDAMSYISSYEPPTPTSKWFT